jgi:lipid-binding SYLF domain-containing protein
LPSFQAYFAAASYWAGGAGNGEWSNPAFITLTGGSIGWQIGAESADIVLIFANDRSIANIANGKFTLGGDASAVAGPLGRHATMAITFKAEVYGYIRSRGLYAGAAFQGVRLKLDERANFDFYTSAVRPLGEQSEATPAPVRRFLLTLERAALATPPSNPSTATEEAQTFPLE